MQSVSMLPVANVLIFHAMYSSRVWAANWVTQRKTTVLIVNKRCHTWLIKNVFCHFTAPSAPVINPQTPNSSTSTSVRVCWSLFSDDTVEYYELYYKPVLEGTTADENEEQDGNTCISFFHPRSSLQSYRLYGLAVKNRSSVGKLKLIH